MHSCSKSLASLEVCCFAFRESDATELETVTEGTAYGVATHYGLDYDEYDFKYIETRAG